MRNGIHVGMVVRSFSTGGGLELYAHKVIEGLLRRGVKVTVICQECTTDFRHPALEIVDFAAPDGRLPKWRRLEQQFQHATDAVQRAGHIDLLHTQHFPVAGADVVTFHNHSVPHLAKVGFPWENAVNLLKGAIVPAYKIRDRYDRMLCTNARAFVFPSMVSRADFCAAYGNLLPLEQTPYVVAHPGADLAHNQMPDQVRQEISATDQAVFLFVGRGYRRKGLDIILSACSLLKRQNCRFKLLIAGLSKKPLDVVRLKAMRIESEVDYLGFREDMDAVYAQASVFVMPSRHDVFGMAPLQAMHWEIVPIVSRCMGVSELLTDRKNALILDNHLDAGRLAGLMRELIDDRELLRSLRSRVREVAAATTWEACVDANLEAYRLARPAVVS